MDPGKLQADDTLKIKNADISWCASHIINDIANI